MRRERIGELNCMLTGGSDGLGGGQGPAIVLLHGFGAPGDDLVPLAEAIDMPSRPRFIFPEAHLALGPEYGPGRAWWPVDVERIQRERAAGRLRDLSREVPDGLAPARERLMGLVGAVPQRLGIDARHLVLGGFSQGAMLACDVGLRMDKSPAALVLLSGTLLNAEEWSRLLRHRRGLPVFISHGTEDPLLPFALAERLRDLMKEAGLQVEWIPFRGGHQIPMPVLAKLRTFLQHVWKGPRS